MKLNGMVTSLLAAGLLLGSAGLAFAQTSQGDTSASNPFAVYQHTFAPSNAGTAVTVSSTAASASNPFAIYRQTFEPSNAGIAVKASNIATPRDEAMSRVSPDPFH